MINFTFGNNNFNTVAGENGFCLGKVGFLAPVRDAETVEIPGSNRVLTLDNGRWKTTKGKYQCFIQSGYGEKIQDVQLWLSQIGFQRLEDDKDTDHFRMARFVGPIEEGRVLYDDIGRFDVNFECMPQKWLKSGETEVTVANNGTITNPTNFEAEPLIVVNGSGNGTLTINGNQIGISDISTSVTLDCAIQRAYNGNMPKDDTISGVYPVLVAGDNTISYTGGITSVKITPRWWTL